MFEDLLVSLGEYSLLKVEDTGRVVPADSIKVPDFRVVLPDGEQWLIEVKNVYIRNPALSQQKRRLMTPEYRKKLENYASATGGHLKLAVFWARWGLWTLVSPAHLVDADGNVTLDMVTAVKENELGILGDLKIGTVPPLSLRFVADPAKARSVSPEGTFEFTIAAVRFYCGDVEILDPIEKNIAWIFMLYGDWEENGPHPLVKDETLTGVEFRWEPPEPTDQGFDIIGTLSTMFARYYAERTVDDGEIVQIRAEPRPEWFEPLIRPDYDGQALPLWRLSQRPSSYFDHEESAGGDQRPDAN